MASENLRLDDIVEIKDTTNADEANKLLADGWTLLELRMEKVVRESPLRTDKGDTIWDSSSGNGSKPAILRNEELATRYLLGKYKPISND